MNKNRFFIASKAIELAESKTYIELTNRLCYYGYPNLNNVVLPVEGAEEKAQTLLNMPVVAKFVKDAQGNPDLGGHECRINPVSGEVTFGTENIGTHTSVEVKEDTVTINGQQVTTPCLFATSRIWTRNKNVVAAIKRLFEEGRLFSSWEILTSSYTFDNGLKTITDYVFESNCMLGTKHQPAFGDTACALDLVASVEPEMLVAQALAEDMGSNESQEEVLMHDEIIAGIPTEEVNTEPTVSDVVEPVAEPAADAIEASIEEPAAPEVVSEEEPAVEEVETIAEETVEEPEVEVSSLTEWDIHKMLTKACREALGCWCYIAYHFPVEKTIWVDYDGKAHELDYKLFTYDVSGDEVALSEPVDVTLTVSVAEINSAIAQRDEALSEANDAIRTHEGTIAELSQYKERLEAIEREREEAELATKRNELKAYALKSGLISSEELDESCEKANEALIAMVNGVDEQGIKGVIAERFMTSLSSTPVVKEQVVATEVARADINQDSVVSGRDFVKAYIRKK